MNGKRCSHAHFAFYFDAAVVSLNDLLGNGKSKPRAGGFAFMFAHPIEFLEKMGNGIFRDAQAGILNGDGLFGIA